MGRVAEDPEQIVFSLGLEMLRGGKILPPFARGEVPEDREGDQHEKCDGGDAVVSNGLLEADYIVVEMARHLLGETLSVERLVR